MTGDGLVWRTRAGERGYDHSRDRIVVPRADETQIITDTQRVAIREQLTRKDDIEVMCRFLASLAYGRMQDRDKWELASLRSMGIDSTKSSEELNAYALLAGQPDQVSDFVHWVKQHPADVASLDDSEQILDSSGHLQTEAMLGQPKGRALEIGTALQLGVWSGSEGLDKAVIKGVGDLQERHGVVDVAQVLRRHKLRFVSSCDTIGLHIVRERPFADIEHLHVIKRSEAYVALTALHANLARKLIEKIAQSNNDDFMLIQQSSKQISADSYDLLRDFLDQYEQLIHLPFEARQQAITEEGLSIIPITTAYLVRDPRRQRV